MISKIKGKNGDFPSPSRSASGGFVLLTPVRCNLFDLFFEVRRPGDQTSICRLECITLHRRLSLGQPASLETFDPMCSKGSHSPIKQDLA